MGLERAMLRHSPSIPVSNETALVGPSVALSPSSNSLPFCWPRSVLSFAVQLGRRVGIGRK